MKRSISKQRYIVYMIMILPIIVSIGTGMVMLNYHGNPDFEIVRFGFNGHVWHTLHALSSVILLPFVVLHLFKGTKWVSNLFTGKLKGKHKKTNIILFFIFLLCSLTALFSWLIFKDSELGDALRGVHNKFGLLFIILSLIHIVNYRKLIFRKKPVK